MITLIDSLSGIIINGLILNTTDPNYNPNETNERDTARSVMTAALGLMMTMQMGYYCYRSYQAKQKEQKKPSLKDKIALDVADTGVAVAPIYPKLTDLIERDLQGPKAKY